MITTLSDFRKAQLKQEGELIAFRRVLDMASPDAVTEPTKAAQRPQISVRMTDCPKCGSRVPEKELTADDECGLCAALRSLRNTLEKRGLLHPELFERANNSVLPPSDRE
jgi:hypothetical protein